jgi:hypothetical protein
MPKECVARGKQSDENYQRRCKSGHAWQARAKLHRLAGVAHDSERNALGTMAIAVHQRVVATDVDGARTAARDECEVQERRGGEERSARESAGAPRSMHDIATALPEGQ